MRILVLLALCFAAVAAVHNHGQRIVGGSVTTIGQYPTMAALLYSWDSNIYWQDCGGIILNSRSVLTAAQCGVGDTTSRWRFRVGSSWANSGGIVHQVNQIIAHPSYNPSTMDSDISIMRSASAIIYNSNVQPASIAGPNYILADNQTVWAAGWGDTYAGSHVGSEQLRHVQVMTINQNICRNNYGTHDVLVTNNMLCSGWPTGGRDHCLFDDGGPLYHNGVVVGVRSFGIGCGEAEFPGINTRVSNFTSWISNNA